MLKGGVLLAAFDARRPTKDVDLAGVGISNDLGTVLELVRRVVAVGSAVDDGIEFDADHMTVGVIREEEDYSGVRVHIESRLASAKLAFHVDVNVGDPIWPEPAIVALPRLRGGAPIELVGYPIHMVHAEKIVTAVQRGMANTRWRDFGDIWTLASRHSIDGADLAQVIGEVAHHRNATIRPLAEVLDGFAALGQARWAQWRRRSNSDHLPEPFRVALEVVIELADPVLTGTALGRTWRPGTSIWA